MKSLLGNCPTQQPSASPAPSSPPSPAPSSTPTEAVCNVESEHTVRIQLLTDSFPEETSWYLTNLNDGVVIEEASYDSSQEYQYFAYTYCIPRTYCYEFAMWDITYG